MYYYFDFFIIIYFDIFTLLRDAEWKDDTSSNTLQNLFGY